MHFAAKMVDFTRLGHNLAAIFFPLSKSPFMHMNSKIYFFLFIGPKAYLRWYNNVHGRVCWPVAHCQDIHSELYTAWQSLLGYLQVHV